MEDLTIIEFKITNGTYGYPSPYIPDGSIVLMIQDNEVKFAKYQNAKQSGFPSFSHPNPFIQNTEVEREIVALIEEKYPDMFSTERSFILTCPKRFIDKIVW